MSGLLCFAFVRAPLLRVRSSSPPNRAPFLRTLPNRTIPQLRSIPSRPFEGEFSCRFAIYEATPVFSLERRAKALGRQFENAQFRHIRQGFGVPGPLFRIHLQSFGFSYSNFPYPYSNFGLSCSNLGFPASNFGKVSARSPFNPSESDNSRQNPTIQTVEGPIAQTHNTIRSRRTRAPQMHSLIRSRRARSCDIIRGQELIRVELPRPPRRHNAQRLNIFRLIGHFGLTRSQQAANRLRSRENPATPSLYTKQPTFPPSNRGIPSQNPMSPDRSIPSRNPVPTVRGVPSRSPMSPDRGSRTRRRRPPSDTRQCHNSKHPKKDPQFRPAAQFSTDSG